jgi:Tol biopolymer transport system component
MKSLPMFLILAALGAPAGFAAGSPLTLVSQADPGQVSDTASGGLQLQDDFPVPPTASISADGRYAAFLSAAGNLVPGQRDVNATPRSDGQDVFLADLTAGTVTLVSHAMGLPTTSGNLSSSAAVISADGRWVVFISTATDLAPGQPTGPFTLGDQNLFLYDRVTGTTTLVAATTEVSSTIGSLGISADGHSITFDSNADLVTGANDGYSNVFLYDRVAATTRLVSHIPGAPTNGPSGAFSYDPRISADGRFILFLTDDPSVLAGQISALSAVLYDRVTDSSKLVGPANNADLSADGNYVAFSLGGTLQLYSRETGTAALVSTNFLTVNSGSQLFALNADGRFLVYVPDDGSGLAVYDRTSRSITPVGRPAGAPLFDFSIGTPVFSADGRYAVFDSADPAWVAGQVDTNTMAGGGSDVFLLDRIAGKIALVSHTATSRTTTGNGASFAPTISANGARVLHFSQATDLEQGLHDLNQRPDLFAYDTASASNQAVTRRAPALPPTSASVDSRAAAMSADGRFVACESSSYGAFSLNNQTDIFLYDRLAKTRLLVDHIRGSAVTPARGLSEGPVLSADGRYVAFFSDARNLVPGTNPSGAPTLDLFDRISGTVTFVAQAYNNQDRLSHPKPRLSADGRWLAFVSNAPDVVPGQQGSLGGNNVFLYDRTTATTLLVSHAVAGLTAAADGESYNPVLSADGRYLAFLSDASNLIPGEGPSDPSGNLAGFLYDRVTGATTLISHLRDSPLAAAAVYSDLSMSSDGRYITLLTDAVDLDPGSPPGDGLALYVYDRAAGTYQQVSFSVEFYGQAAEISADGRVVAFPGGYGVLPNTQPGLFLYDRVTRSLSLAAANDYLGAGNDTLALSGDGRYVAFASDTFGLVPALTRTAVWGGTDVYLLDRTTGSTILINQFLGSPVTTAGFAATPLLSADGQTVVFTSGVDLVPGDYNNQLDAYAFTFGGSTPGGPVTVPPCILLDTRRPADAPALRSNAARVVKAAGACGVPATATKVSVKVTTFQGTGQGNVRFYPGDLSAPSTGILRFTRGQTRAASFDLPLAANAGTLTILPFVAGNGTVGVSVEIDGYTP